MQRCSWSSERGGLTLIEVVVSVLLVGTLLTAVLTAHRRSTSQYRLAERRVRAVAALDRLLLARTSGAPEFMLARGRVPDDSQLEWRCRYRQASLLPALHADIVRIEVYDPALDDGKCLAWAEVVETSQGLAEERFLP